MELGLVVALIIAQIALLIALAIFIFEHAGAIFSNFLDVPYVPTPRTYWPTIIEALNIHEGDVVYDLGCGNGRCIIACAGKYPSARFIGIERNWMLYTQARFWKWWVRNPSNVTFRRENFYQTDLRDATKIYAYLLSNIMDRLFSSRDQKGLRIVSRAFYIKGKTPIETIDLEKDPGGHGQYRLHVYEL